MNTTQDCILKLPEVLDVSGLSEDSLARGIKRGDFPAPVKLGPRAIGWRASDIQRWIDGLQPANAAQPAGSKE